MSDWPRSHRRCYADGGIRVENSAGSRVVSIKLSPSIEYASLSIEKYNHLFNLVEGAGISIIGVEFITLEAELNGVYPSEWRIHDPVEGWIGHDVVDRFRMAAEAFRQDDRVQEWDLCNRIAYQLSTAEARLRALGEAYWRLLSSACLTKIYEKLGRFSNGWEVGVAREAQALLNDLGSLRDYVVEFACQFCAEDSDLTGVKTAGALAKRRNKVSSSNKYVTLLVGELCSENSGSLRELGLYRDFVTHSAPLVQGGSGIFFARAIERKLTSGSIPMVNVYLPANVFELVGRRSRSDYPNDFSEWNREIREILLQEEDANLDCQIYLYRQLKKLIIFADTFLKVSSIEMKRIEIGAEDIIGPIKFSTVRTV